MKLSPDQKAGLYITAIIHLAVIIVLLASRIGYFIKKENSFVLDFSAQEKAEQTRAREELNRSAMEKLEQMLASMPSAPAGAPVRNVTVDASTILKDDRNTDAEQLYRDAERLARELREGQNAQKEESPDDYVEISKPVKKEETKKESSYKGPSVLSWYLEGRNASSLPIPSYLCYGAGTVKVLIVVDNQGNVVNAKVDEAESSTDKCLRDFAIRAARMSRFSASPTAVSRQPGYITYAFISQ